MIKRGDVVRIKPEWSDPGDADVTFVALDDESKGRVTIMALLGLPINPVQVVNVEMVEKDVVASSPHAARQQDE